jgi:hypothetical protein
VRVPSPCSCLVTGGLLLCSLTAVDAGLLLSGRPLPVSQLHHLVVTIGAALGASGLVGLHVRQAIAIGRRLERAREAGRQPGSSVVPFRQRPQPRPRMRA